MAKKNFMSAFNAATEKMDVSSFELEEKIKYSLVVIEALRAFISPLNTLEVTELEENIKQYGCKDPLDVWETNERMAGISDDAAATSYVLIDGHNRYRICKENRIDFKISPPMKFESIAEVEIYMMKKQLGRRNFTDEQRAYYIGKIYNDSKLATGKYDRNETKTHGEQNVPHESSGGKHLKTADKLAQDFAVSHMTIKRNAALAKGVERLPEKERIQFLQGKSTLSKSEVTQLGQIEANEAHHFENNTAKPKELISVINKIIPLIKNLPTEDACIQLILKIKEHQHYLSLNKK